MRFKAGVFRGGGKRENEWSQSGSEEHGGYLLPSPYPVVRGQREKYNFPLKGLEGKQWSQGKPSFC